MSAIDITSFCKALGDETRQQILEILQTEGEMCVSDLVERFNVAQPTISHHLTFLKHANLVSSRRDGKQIYYQANEKNIVNCCGMIFTRFVPTSLELEGLVKPEEKLTN